MSKPYRTIVVERQIALPAEQVWNALVMDYGQISNYSPLVYASDYVDGSLKGEVGAQRTCAFNASGNRWAKETIAELDHERMRMKNIMVEAHKFPLNTDNSYAIYYVKDNGDGTSTAGYEFNFRAKPAFMGFMMARQFKKGLNETLIGLEHFLTTGERVTGGSDSVDIVMKAYKSDGRYDDYVYRKS